jgi:enoyl-CoA hydratase
MDDILTMEFDGPVAVLTLNRPAVLNALNTDLLTLLEETLDAFIGDPSLRAVIITGAGAVAGEHKSRTGQRITQLIEALPVPVIAAVNGFALGGGCELAMACDFRIASENAKFGQPEVNLGVPPGYGGTQRTTRLLGAGMALFMCLTGEMIDAAEALRIGLVQRVVPIGELLPEARRLAQGIAAKAPLAITATKRAIREGAALPLTEGLALEALHFGAMVTTSDFREGTRAFLDKRKPVFEGR